MKRLSSLALACLLTCFVTGPQGLSEAQNQNSKIQSEEQASENLRVTTALIVDEVRHQLITLPYYGVFDWLEGEVVAGNTVVLRGQVTRPSTKSDAEARVKKLENVVKVMDQIEVLPSSPSDDRLRIAVYRAIFNYDSPLFRYATLANPPIHIIINNGRAVLKGIVATDNDRQLVYMAALSVSNVFEVKNELMVDAS